MRETNARKTHPQKGVFQRVFYLRSKPPCKRSGHVSAVTNEETVKEILQRLRHHPVVNPTWMSAQATAAYLGIAEETLCAWVKQGVAPPSIKFSSKMRRFKRDDVDAWVEHGGPSQFRNTKTKARK